MNKFFKNVNGVAVILMPIIILLENVRINPLPLKWLYRFNAKLYGKINKHSKYIGDDLTWTYRNPLKPLRCMKDKILPTVRVPFEDTELPVPNDSKDYLMRNYGENYMTPPPINKRIPIHVYDINLASSEPEE